MRRLGPYTTSSGGPPSDSGANGQSRVQQDAQGADWKDSSLKSLSGWPKTGFHASWRGSMMSLLLPKTPVTITLTSPTQLARLRRRGGEEQNRLRGFLGLGSSF